MAWVKSNLDTFIRRNVLPQIKSSFATIKPLLYMVVGRDAAGLDKLGDPNTGLMFGGKGVMGDATKKVVNGDEHLEVVFQNAQTDVAETITYRGDTPTATNYGEDNFGTAKHHWADYWCPFKFGQHSVDMSNNSQLRLQSIVELTMMQSYQRMLEKIQSDLWTGSLTSAQQATRLWNSILGLRHQVSDGSTDSSNYAVIGQVDRTVETELQSIVKAAATEVSAGNIQDSKVRLELIRKAKIKYGLTNKFAGAGDFVITTPDLFDVLADEAESRNLRIHSGGIPEIGMEGFKLPMIEYGGTLITYDPDCPEGEMYILTSRSWVVEVKKGANFQMEGNIKQKWNTEEGGGYYNWGQLHTQIRMVCLEPWLQFKWTGLTTDGS